MITNAQGFRSFFDDNPSLLSSMKQVIFSVSQSTKSATPFDFFNEPPKPKPQSINNNQNLVDKDGNPLENIDPNHLNASNSNQKLSHSIVLPNSKNGKNNNFKDSQNDLNNPDENAEEWGALFKAFKYSMNYLVLTEPKYLINNGVTSAITGENAQKITDKILANPETFKTFLESANELILEKHEKIESNEETRLRYARHLEDNINQMDGILETKSVGFNPAARARFLAHYESALELQKDKSSSMMPTNPLTLGKTF